MFRRRLRTTVAGLCLASALVACGNANSGTTPNGGTIAESGSGPITFATGKDTSGNLQALVDKWNSGHPGRDVSLVELPEAPDAQRSAMVQQFQARTGSFDVVDLDVTWTAEFAARGWIVPLGTQFDTRRLVRAAVQTATYAGTLYAAPWKTGAGLLYYRSDLVKTPPRTWNELYRDCTTVAEPRGIDCYAGQFAQYEGLTVNASEAVNSAGGSFLSPDGTKVTVDSSQTRRGLQHLVDGFAKGAIPEQAVTFQEEEGRRQFQQGKLLFLRNWSYVYGLASAKGPDSKIQGKFGVVPEPGPAGQGVSSLGGANLAINSQSDHKRTALAFLRYLTSEPVQRVVFTKLSTPATFAALYDDPRLVKEAPYVPALKQALRKAQPRPQTVDYNAVTTAIAKDVYAALQGDASVDETVDRLETDLRHVVER